MTSTLAAAINNALPQTQCTRCGYPDCQAYADAIAWDEAPINQCPPGGAEGIRRLAALTQRPILPLSAEHGEEGPRSVVVIDEQWCIGCTLCLKACPVDAIVGANKTMHTVLEADCTGCELCIPVCPVDCMTLEPVTGTATGWLAWSDAQAQQALNRYVKRAERLGLTVGAEQAALHQRRTLSQRTNTPAVDTPAFMGNPKALASAKPTATAEHVSTDSMAPSGKAALLADILKKAQARRNS